MGVLVETNKWQFANFVHASWACRLLGITTEELNQFLWPDSELLLDKDNPKIGEEAIEGFAVSLYGELVEIINCLINR